MATVHPGATLTPHFRDFLPPWLARQPWYAGTGLPSVTPVGYFRFEDPAGQVGIETHLVSAGAELYQIPMTYRGAPLGGDAADALIATPEHSVLGTRWIYDAQADPVWLTELLRLIQTNGVSEDSGRPRVGRAQVRGRRLTSEELTRDTVRVELVRRLTPGVPADDPSIAGLVMGTWYPHGPDAATASGCLALARRAAVEPAAGTPG